jgi:hypothetical protein
MSPPPAILRKGGGEGPQNPPRVTLKSVNMACIAYIDNKYMRTVKRQYILQR